ncbi:hypothetical protein L7F22_053653 [Adiantum nelumboides]|nr:hypothetical protein [Adiantum nelumboides]
MKPSLDDEQGKICKLQSRRKGVIMRVDVLDPKDEVDLLLEEDAASFSSSKMLQSLMEPFIDFKIDGELETSQSTPLGSCPLEPEEEVEDVEVQFDPKEEQLKVSKETFDAGLALASLADAAIGCKQESPNKKVTLPLNCTPTFAMAGNTHYVLLTNIMHELNIREDCYLAAIVNFCEADMGFLNDDEVDQHLIADTTVHDSQFTSRPVALRAQVMNSESIHLWGRSMLEMDENHMVLLYDDSFLRRAGGSRQGLLTGVQGKDAALSHYIERFNHKKIIIYHKKYSEDNAKFPLEVITRLCGGHPLPLNTERLILIEKQFSLRVFGIGYGCQALRAPHFMSYTAQAVVADTKELSDIGIQCISHYDWHEDPLGTPIFPIPKNEIFHINGVAFEVRLSCIQGAGYGLFVHSAIESGVTILHYGGPKYGFQEWKKICKLIPRAIKYSLVEDPKVEEEEDRAYILGFVEEGNVSGYINSSHCMDFHPNVRYALDPNLPPWYKGISSHIKSEEYGHICIETICRVEPGEELFANYEFT